MTTPPAPDNSTAAREPVDRTRSAALVLITVAVVNSFFAIMSLGALKVTAAQKENVHGLRRLLLDYPLAGTALFAAIAITAVIIGRALVVKKGWAPAMARGFAVVLMLGIVLITQLGGLVIINLILGFMTMLNLHLAEAMKRPE